jgi:hypothetical protein
MVIFTTLATQAQDRLRRNLPSQIHLGNALEAHRERYSRQMAMASWCAIDSGGRVVESQVPTWPMRLKLPGQGLGTGSPALISPTAASAETVPFFACRGLC